MGLARRQSMGDRIRQADPVTTPACPLCGSSRRVSGSANLPPIGWAGNSVTYPWRWLCGLCWTVFTGGETEWGRMREQREAWTKQNAHLIDPDPIQGELERKDLT